MQAPIFSNDCEQAIIGAMMLNHGIALSVLSTLDQDSFFLQRHSTIFAAMRELFEANKGIDPVSVKQVLVDNGELEAIGGALYLAQLLNTIPSERMVSDYCEIVTEKSRVRHLIGLCRKAEEMCNGGSSTTEIISDLSSGILSVTKEEQKNTGTLAEITDFVVQDLIGRGNGTIDPMGIPTGFTELDNLMGGLQKTDLILIAGRPSMGKTTLGMNIVTNAAKKGFKVLIFSLEMSREKLVTKQISAMSGVSYKAMQRGYLNEKTWPHVHRAAAELKKYQVVIDDSSALHISQIQARAKMTALKHGVDLILVDYLQLARAKADSREREVAEISAGLKAIAKDLKVPVIALSQLSRKCEDRTDKRPLMSDLRDSGSIEQDADVICFIYRDEVYNKEPGNPAEGKAEILIRKNRCGEVGDVKMFFDGSRCEFKNIEPDH